MVRVALAPYQLPAVDAMIVPFCFKQLYLAAVKSEVRGARRGRLESLRERVTEGPCGVRSMRGQHGEPVGNPFRRFRLDRGSGQGSATVFPHFPRGSAWSQCLGRVFRAKGPSSGLSRPGPINYPLPPHCSFVRLHRSVEQDVRGEDCPRGPELEDARERLPLGGLESRDAGELHCELADGRVRRRSGAHAPSPRNSPLALTTTWWVLVDQSIPANILNCVIAFLRSKKGPAGAYANPSTGARGRWGLSAASDRPAHHCEIIETGNESWRFRNRS